jgi:hypothetical protein
VLLELRRISSQALMPLREDFNQRMTMKTRKALEKMMKMRKRMMTLKVEQLTTMTRKVVTTTSESSNSSSVLHNS